jgi:hypothetical protein
MSKQPHQNPAKKHVGTEEAATPQPVNAVLGLRAGQEYYCEWYCSSGTWWPGNSNAPPGYYCPPKPLFYPEPCSGTSMCIEDPIPMYGLLAPALAERRAAMQADRSAHAAGTNSAPALQSTRFAADAAPAVEGDKAQECCPPAAAAGFCCHYTYEQGRFWLRESSVPAGYYCPPDPIEFAKAHGYLLTLPAPRAICEALSHKPDHT